MNRDLYLDTQEGFLRGVEKEIADQVRPTMDEAIRKMERLGRDATDEAYAAALEQLNDTLSDAIGSAMFLHQRRIAQDAQQVAGGTLPRMKSPSELLAYGTVDKENIANQFKRDLDV